MSQKKYKSSQKEENLHIEVEEWQWENNSTRLTWKHWLVFALLFAGGLLFAFGFLIISVIALGISLVFGLVLFILRKLEN